MDDAALVQRLRSGDEAAFAELVDCYHASMVRIARTFVASRAVAEDVVQNTWVAVLRASTASRAGRRSGPGSSGSSRTAPGPPAPGSSAPARST